MGEWAFYRSQKGVWVVDACTQLSHCSESNTSKIIDSEMEAGLSEGLEGLHCRSLSITNSSPSQSLQTHRIIYPEPLYLSHLDPCGCLYASLRCRGWVAVVPSWSSFGHIKFGFQVQQFCLQSTGDVANRKRKRLGVHPR